MAVIADSDQNWLARCSTVKGSGKICSLPWNGKYWKSHENLWWIVSSILETREIWSWSSKTSSCVWLLTVWVAPLFLWDYVEAQCYSKYYTCRELSHKILPSHDLIRYPGFCETSKTRWMTPSCEVWYHRKLPGFTFLPNDMPLM